MIHRAVGHEVLEILSKETSQMVIAFDSSGAICLFNPAAEEALITAASEVLGMRWGDACAAHPSFNAVTSYVESVINGAPVAAGQVALVDGRTVPVVVARVPEVSQTTGWASVVGQMEQANDFREIVHDLKAPIMAATSFIDLARADGVAMEKRMYFLRRAQRSLDAMFAMINELLDMAWLGTDGELHCIDTDLNDIVDSGVRHMDGFAQHSGLTLHYAFEGASCPVCGDERRLLGVVTNLISNAIKYSVDGGIVNVLVDSEDARARVRVVDHGLGIASEHLSHIWEPYYRVPNAATRRIEGSGLGLSLVKTVVEKHGGEVFVNSVPGEGSTFGFWLPLGDASPQST